MRWQQKQENRNLKWNSDVAKGDQAFKLKQDSLKKQTDRVSASFTSSSCPTKDTEALNIVQYQQKRKLIQFTSDRKPMAAVLKCALGFHWCCCAGPRSLTRAGCTFVIYWEVAAGDLRLYREERAAPVAAGRNMRSRTERLRQHSILFHSVSRFRQKAL